MLLLLFTLKHFSDEEVNFAIQKGLLSSKAELVYFKHNCPDDLEQLILKNEINAVVSSPSSIQWLMS